MYGNARSPNREAIQHQFAKLADDPENLSKQMIHLAIQASISQLVNAIAHQLNNSLTPILGYAQLLQEGGIEKKESKTYLKRIFSEAEHLSKIVENMLVFTRRRNAGRELVDINSLVRETAALQAYEIEKRDVVIQFQLDPQLPPTVTDPFQLQIVFLNIIKNALQAIENHLNEGAIVIRTRSDGEHIYIEFTDDGTGIHPKLVERIFEPFFTTRTDERKPGIGLGLTVCQHVIQEQDGNISVQSSLGQGSTFTIELPITDAMPETHNDAIETAKKLWI